MHAAQDVGRDDIEPQDPVGGDADALLAEGAQWTPRSGSGDGAEAGQAPDTVRPWVLDRPGITTCGPLLRGLPLKSCVASRYAGPT